MGIMDGIGFMANRSARLKQEQAAMEQMMMEKGFTRPEGYERPNAGGGMMDALNSGFLFRPPEGDRTNFINPQREDENRLRDLEHANLITEGDRGDVDREAEMARRQLELERDLEDRKAELAKRLREIEQDEADLAATIAGTGGTDANTKYIDSLTKTNNLEGDKKLFAFNEFKNNSPYRKELRNIALDKAKIELHGTRYQLLDTEEGLYMRDLETGEFKRLLDRNSTPEQKKMVSDAFAAKLAAAVHPVDPGLAKKIVEEALGEGTPEKDLLAKFDELGLEEDDGTMSYVDQPPAYTPSSGNPSLRPQGPMVPQGLPIPQRGTPSGYDSYGQPLGATEGAGVSGDPEMENDPEFIKLLTTTNLTRAQAEAYWRRRKDTWGPSPAPLKALWKMGGA